MKKLIEHYKKWAENGQLPSSGLCGSISFKYDSAFELIKPTDIEKETLRENKLSSLYWGSGLPVAAEYNEKRWALTPLRETIILLICAMHDEI
jgi:hypothetical protein